MPYPVKLLPLLLFESAWKLLWLGGVALLKGVDGSLDAATSETVFRCSLVVRIIAVIPWPYMWRTYLPANGDRWRRAPENVGRASSPTTDDWLVDVSDR